MKININKLWPLIIVSLFALAAAWPLFQPGFIPTHDGEYHLIRFYEFETMLRNGYWFPRWAPDLNSGYGVPLFNFNYPLPNYIGVFFHALGFSLADSFKLALATGYLSAVIFCFLWLAKLFNKKIAMASAIIFAYVPYWFVDIYVRGSVGEVLAISFLMIALAATERGWWLVLAVVIGLMILSHNILAMIFLPTIIVYLLIAKPHLWWTILVGMGISAYFWIPALAEQKYVVGLNTVNFRDYFATIAQLLVPSWGTGLYGSGPGNEMSVQIGIVPILILIVASVFFFKDRLNRKDIRLLLFLSLAIVSIFLTLKSSLIFWQIIPFLSFTQYPWRLLSVLLPTTAFLSSFIFSKINKTLFIWGVVIFAVILAFSYSRPVVYQPRSDQYYLSKSNFTDGTNSLGNLFSTIWTPWKQARPEKKVEFVLGNGEIDLKISKPLDYEFSTKTDSLSTIRLNVLYYPGWAVFVDGKSVMINYEKNGTIDFMLNPGRHKVRAVFHETNVRQIVDVVSILSLFWLISWVILKK